MKSQIINLLNRILQATVADVGRTEQSDHDENGRWAKKNGNYYSSAEEVKNALQGTKEWMKAPNGQHSHLTEKAWCAVRTDAFKKWFGDWQNNDGSQVLDDNGEPLVVYHGTTGGDFDTFDKKYGNPEGDMGAGFYFTDNYSDVQENYEGGGPDFEIKLNMLAERIADNEEIPYEEARKKATQKLYKGSALYATFLNVKNPARVGETVLFSPDEIEVDIDRDDYDNDDDYDQDYQNAIDDKIREQVDDAIYHVQEKYNIDEDELSSVLWDAVYNGGSDMQSLKDDINKHYFDDDDGNVIGNEIFRLVVESLGYDGIIDNTVSEKFDMGMEEGTTHYIVFEPNQIKSATKNNGNFSLEKNGIYDKRKSHKPLKIIKS